MRRRNPLPATLMVMVSCVFVVQAQTETQGEALPESLGQAKSLEARGEFGAAERELRAYLTVHPGDAAALFALGGVLHREDKPKESLAAYTEAARGATPSPEDLRIVALDYVLLDDYPDAVGWLERAVAGDPANAEAWYDLGRAQMMQKDFPDAERALKRSLALVDKPLGSAAGVKAENNLGVTYEGEGRSAEAADAYRTAIAWQRPLPRPSEQPLLNYGKLLIDQNRAAEAVAPLEEAARIAPKDPKCHEQLARALDKAGSQTHSAQKDRAQMDRVQADRAQADRAQMDRAQAEMLEAIRLDPTNARLHFQLGLMYRRAGKAELAREQMALSGSLYGSHSTASDH